MMCKIFAHQPNLLPSPGGGQPISAGPSVETRTERQELGSSYLSSPGHILQLPRPLGTMPISSSAAYRSWRQGLERGSLLCVGKNPWRRERLPNPAFWPGECHVAKSQIWLSEFHFHFGCFVAWIWPVGTRGEGSGTLWDTGPKLSWGPSHPPALRPEGLDSAWRRPLSQTHQTRVRTAARSPVGGA